MGVKLRGLLALALLMSLGTTTIHAQEGSQTYTDPSGRLTVAIPTGWQDQSTAQFGHFVNQTPPADTWIIVVKDTNMMTAITTAAQQINDELPALVALKPVGPRAVPLPNGTWEQMVYVATDDTIVITIGIVKGDVTCFLIFRASNANLAALTPALNEYLLKARFPLEESAPSYADPQLFTEREVTITTGEWSLPGILTMPNGTGTFAAVVLVHGSGPNDRDEALGPNRPFRDLAWGLASQGIAVLRYDKRTLVYKEKSANPIESLTVQEETIDDALSAVALLRTTKGIDPDRVFVLGHSLGGMLIPRIGASDPLITGLIILAGNTRPLEDLIVIQSNYLAGADGSISLAEKTEIDAITKQVEAIKALTPQDKSSKGLFIMGAPAAYWLDLRVYNQVETARSLAHPLLILQGERDYQVTFKEDFLGWKDGLAGRTGVTFKSYPELNHLFMPGKGEGLSTPEEYSMPGHIPVEVITDIAHWINELP